jgi:uncharacterized membrane protein
MTANSVTGYLTQLRAALAGSDAAIIQDALSDAEEHLRSALESMMADQPELPENEALQAIIAGYGQPEEIAEAYREVEAYTRPIWVSSEPKKKRNIFARFFGIFIDPQAWGALIYLLLSLITGALYFCWAFIGVSTSLIFSLFIFGLPLAAFFMLSIRGVALFEGRIVEALLGVRMPRRAVFTPANVNWRERLKAQLTDKQTWLILVYMILQGVLGYIYFAVFILLIATALMFVGVPVFSSLGLPIVTINDMHYFAPVELLPVAVLTGILLAAVTMHLAKLIGKCHGRYAKFMLVGE